MGHRRLQARQSPDEGEFVRLRLTIPEVVFTGVVKTD